VVVRPRALGNSVDWCALMRGWLVALTEFGDIAVLMPLAAVMLLWLLLMRSPRAAAWWAIAVAVCASLTAMLKVSFYGCPPIPDLRSPSGHTSFSTLVYGAMALVTATERIGSRRIIAISGGVSFIVAIAVSHLLVYAHSALAVGLGLVIGISSVSVFGQGYLRDRPARVWLSPVFVAGGGWCWLCTAENSMPISSSMRSPTSSGSVASESLWPRIRRMCRSAVRACSDRPTEHLA
jgi:membrane-associated phospholipid phosphatase